ncbi:MAG: ArnT family glycosyltransferase [Chloroflexota bacterium]
MTLLGNIADLSVFLLIVMTAIGLGRRGLGLIGVSPASVLEDVVLSLGLGLGTFSLLGATLGFIGFLRWELSWLLFLVLLALAVTPALAILSLFRTELSASIRGIRGPAILPAAVLGLSVGVYFLAAFHPPVEGDTLAGYLAAPRRFVQFGRIAPLPASFYDDLPLNVQMLSTWALLLRGDVLAQLLVGFGFGVACLGAIAALSASLFGNGVAPWALLAFFSLGAVSYANNSTKIDVGWAFFDLVSLLAFSRWFFGRGDWRWLALAGMFGGLGLGSKYTALFTMTPLVAGIVWRTLRWDKGAFRQLAGRLALYLIPCLLLGGIWMLKNALYVGNPVYPLFNKQILGYAADSPPNHASGLLGMITIIWDMSMGPIAFGFGKTVGPVMLATVPLLFVLKDRDRKLWYLLAFVGVGYVLWYVGVQRDRNFLPQLAVLGMCGAYALRGLTASPSPARFAVAGLALLGPLYALATYGWVHVYRMAPLPYIVGIQDRESYLRRNLLDWYPSFDAITFINSSLPANARIIGVHNGNGYYLDREYILSDDLEGRIIHDIGTERELLAALRARRITHIFINGFVIQQWRMGYGGKQSYTESLVEQPEFQTQHMMLIFEHSGQRLYELRYPPGLG